MPKRPYPSWQRRHDAVLLYVVDHPVAKQKEIADATGYTPSQISRILNSYDFQLRYEHMMKRVYADAKVRSLFFPRQIHG